MSRRAAAETAIAKTLPCSGERFSWFIANPKIDRTTAVDVRPGDDSYSDGSPAGRVFHRR